MQRGTAWIAAAITALLACGGSAPGPEPPPAPERGLRFRDGASMFKAPSGLRILLLPDEQTNLVHVALRVAAGSAEDPEGKAGLAHLVEHLLFEIRPEGTDGPTLAERLAPDVLSYNAHTSADATHFASTALSGELEALIRAELTRLGASCASLTEEDFAREREVVRNEIRQRYGGAQIGRLILAEAYPDGHPYARPVGGDDAQIASLERQDVCDFLERYYAPSRALLVVSGDFEPEELRAILPRYLPLAGAGGGANRPAARPPSYADPAPRSVRRLAIDEPMAIALAALPPRSSEDHLAARFLIEAAEGEITSAAMEKGEILDGRAAVIGGGRAPVLAVFASVASDDELHIAREAVEEALAAARGSSSATVLRARRERLRIDLLVRAERLASRAVLYADYWQYGRRLDFVVGDLERLEQLNVPLLQDAAHRILDTHKLVLVRSDPDAPAAPGRAPLEFDPGPGDGEHRSIPVDPAAAERPLEVESSRPTRLPRRIELENGLEVWLQPTEGFPLVDMRLLLRAGRADEPRLQAGLAELTARVLEHRREDVRIALSAAETGALTRVSVSPDVTRFRSVGLASFVDVHLAGLAALVIGGTHDGERWKRIRGLLRSTLAEEDAPAHRAAEALRAGVFGAEHPYGQMGELSYGSVGLIERDDLEGFRRRYYRPDRAILILSGRFDPDLVEEHVRYHFGRWSAEGEAPPASRPPRPERAGRVRHTIPGPPGAQAEIQFAYPTPEGISGDYAARLVLERVLDQRASRIRQGLAASYGVGGDHRTLIGPGMLLVRGAVDPQRLEDVVVTLDEELSALREGAGLETALVLARREVVEKLLADAGDAASVAARTEFLALHELPADFHDRLVQDVARVDTARLRAAIDELLDSERETFVLVAPEVDQAKESP